MESKASCSCQASGQDRWLPRPAPPRPAPASSRLAEGAPCSLTHQQARGGGAEDEVILIADPNQASHQSLACKSTPHGFSVKPGLACLASRCVAQQAQHTKERHRGDGYDSGRSGSSTLTAVHQGSLDCLAHCAGLHFSAGKDCSNRTTSSKQKRVSTETNTPCHQHRARSGAAKDQVCAGVSASYH